MVCLSNFLAAYSFFKKIWPLTDCQLIQHLLSYKIPEYADLSLKDWVMVAGKACSFGLSFSLNAEMLKKKADRKLCVLSVKLLKLHVRIMERT